MAGILTRSVSCHLTSLLFLPPCRFRVRGHVNVTRTLFLETTTDAYPRSHAQAVLKQAEVGADNQWPCQLVRLRPDGLEHDVIEGRCG